MMAGVFVVKAMIGCQDATIRKKKPLMLRVKLLDVKKVNCSLKAETEKSELETLMVMIHVHPKIRANPEFYKYGIK